jgi:2'-5' RNA ligase
LRSFIAIDLPDAVTTAVERLQATLPVGRPVQPETLHLTLAFLGEQGPAALEEAHVELERLAAPRFDLTLSGLDTFGGADPRVVYVAVVRNEALDRLHKQVRSALRSAGIELERVRFRPHVTLARLPRGLSPDDLERLRRFLSVHAHFRPPPFTVAAFTLYRSTLHPDGAIHEVLAQYPLR